MRHGSVAKEGGTIDAIRKHFKKHPEAVFANDLAAMLGIENTGVHASLGYMHDRGELARCVVERPGQRPQYQYRPSAAGGYIVGAVPFSEFRVKGTPPPRRTSSEPMNRPKLLDPCPITDPSLLRVPQQEPTAAAVTEPAPEVVGGGEHFRREMEKVFAEPCREPDPKALEWQSAQIAPQLQKIFADHPEEAQAIADEATAGPIPREFRAALYSDGTLILENVPHVVEPIIALRGDTVEVLRKLLRGEVHA